jgi:hypothetical protein
MWHRYHIPATISLVTSESQGVTGGKGSCGTTYVR